MDHRTIAFGKFQPDPHRFEDQQNVGKENRRIHTESLHRFDCDLGSQIGRLA